MRNQLFLFLWKSSHSNLDYQKRITKMANKEIITKNYSSELFLSLKLSLMFSKGLIICPHPQDHHTGLCVPSCVPCS